MKFIAPIALSLACLLALTACNKSQKEHTATPVSNDEPALKLDNSPTAQLMAQTLKLGVWGVIKSSSQDPQNFKLSDTELACLLDYDKALFVEAGNAETQRMLDEELLSASDEFYRTEAGQALLQFVTQLKINHQGNPMPEDDTMVAEEYVVKSNEFNESEIGQKLKAVAQSEQDVASTQKLLMELANKEKARCQIAH